MKKAYFITIHVGWNFGSVLQAIATYKILSDLLPGYDVTLVDYVPPRVTYMRVLRNSFKSLKAFAKLPFSLLQKKYNDALYLSDLRKYCPSTRRVYNISQIGKELKDAELLITGSDQTWNSVHNEGIDRAYYWDYLNPSIRRIAFASSIGRSEIPAEEYNYLQKVLKSFSFISVREESAVKLLSSMGVKSELFLDPTLMIDKEQWCSYINKRIIDEPYILVYLPYNINDKSIILDSINKLKQTKHMKVVTFSWGMFNDKDNYADKTVHYASPLDFLSLMCFADYVITNSFHGTAFSINLNKQFWVYYPSQFTTRIESLLNFIGLQSRHMNSVLTDGQIEGTIDYSVVNNLLNVERKRSSSILRKIQK